MLDITNGTRIDRIARQERDKYSQNNIRRSYKKMRDIERQNYRHYAVPYKFPFSRVSVLG